MRRLYPPRLSAYATRYLAGKQRDVNSQHPYDAQVARGKALWKKTGRTKSFDEIRRHLSAMSHGRRCHYCEDSCADEVEHFRPKDLYPGWCYRWENYLYSCGPCNGTAKNRKFAVIDARGRLIDVTRQPKAAVVPPSATGTPALIDPRTEDPLRFMKLDLLDTFEFVALDDPADPTLKLRADYTITTLGLNDRDALTAQRRIAFQDFVSHLFRYIAVSQTHPGSTQLPLIEETVRRHDHRTVWEEMKRQHSDIAELARMFALAPGALGW
jgi:uncharacterized protein (TIGR02646 family)